MTDKPSFPYPLPCKYKSVAAALLLSVVLGPVGLLYASFWGGIVMICMGIVVLSNKLFFPIVLVWIISCIWSVGAAEIQNKKFFEQYFKPYQSN